MDKFGVVTNEENVKIATLEGRPCPSCGSKNVNYKGTTPHCPKCGTKPWEPTPHGSTKEDFRR